MKNLKRTNRKWMTLPAVLWLALMGLLLLSGAPSTAGKLDLAVALSKLQSLEDAYNKASLKTRELEKSDFVSFLIANLGHPNRSVRRRVTYLTNVYFAEDPQVLARMVDLLEPNRFAELPVQARINAMNFLAKVPRKAWAPELLERATENIRQIGTAPPDDWAAQQQEGYAILRKRTVDLAELPSTAGPVEVSQPAPGAVVPVSVQEGQLLIMDFDPSLAQVRIDEDGNLVFTFNFGTADEARLVLLGLVGLAGSDDPPVLQITGVNIGSDVLIDMVKSTW